MKIDVFCDESYPDLFSSKLPRTKYLVIGSLWLPRENRIQFKEEIRQIGDMCKIGKEFKWGKVTPSKLEFYRRIIHWFFLKKDAITFRSIVIDRSKISLAQFRENNRELGFYEFYYQMLRQWIDDFNEYAFYCDFGHNRFSNRLHVLERCLNRVSCVSTVSRVQAIDSKESVFIQLTDLLTGIVSAMLNGTLRQGSAKESLVHLVEHILFQERQILAQFASRSEKKFNVFVVDSSEGG